MKTKRKPVRRRKAPAAVTRSAPEGAVTCAACRSVFTDEAALSRHIVSLPSAGSPTPCLRPSSMTSTGWSCRSGAWSPPAAPRRRPTVPPEDACGCARCGQWFNDLALFQAHQIRHLDDGARCLDPDELTALSWVRKASGVWSSDITSQTQASQIARLPTVRAPLWTAA